MTRVIVIGAGVVGASCAYRLAEAGADVLVVEADRVGGGTSGISYAWTNAYRKPPRPYHDLNVAGMKAHAAVMQEFPGATWWHGGGRLEWVEPDDLESQRTAIEELCAWGYRVDWLTADEAAELEPDIDQSVLASVPAAFFPDEGWLDPVPYCHAMIAAAMRRYKARLICGTKVVDVMIRTDRAVGVKLADGSEQGADIVVNCAGRWTNDVVHETGLHLPMASTVGFLVFTPPVASALSRVIHSPLVDIRPDGAGRIMIHWNPTDATLRPDSPISPDMPQARELMARLRRLIPSIGSVEAEAVRLAIRPIPGDGLTAIGPMPRLGGYYLAVTHSGVTLSPFLGQCAADEIMRGITRPELATFRPVRFFN